MRQKVLSNKILPYEKFYNNIWGNEMKICDKFAGSSSQLPNFDEPSSKPIGNSSHLPNSGEHFDEPVENSSQLPNPDEPSGEPIGNSSQLSNSGEPFDQSPNESPSKPEGSFDHSPNGSPSESEKPTSQSSSSKSYESCSEYQPDSTSTESGSSLSTGDQSRYPNVFNRKKKWLRRECRHRNIDPGNLYIPEMQAVIALYEYNIRAGSARFDEYSSLVAGWYKTLLRKNLQKLGRDRGLTNYQLGGTRHQIVEAMIASLADVRIVFTITKVIPITNIYLF